MDLQKIETIKKLGIIAVVSDDYLMETLVLKGGNAVDLIHGLAGRASMDLDFSMAGDFPSKDLPMVFEKLQETLTRVFAESGFRVFDITMAPRPTQLRTELFDFWGGYKVNFKVIDENHYERLRGEAEAIRRESIVIGVNQARKFTIDISRHEWVENKVAAVLDGYRLYVYSPQLIIAEKIRAICQQLPEYAQVIGTDTRTPRARDFFDIYTIANHFGLKVKDNDLDIIRCVFAAKRVPLKWIPRIASQRDFHSSDFQMVRDTVKKGVKLEDFDFYFDWVVSYLVQLEPLWIE